MESLTDCLPILRLKFSSLNKSEIRKIGCELEFPIVSLDGKKPNFSILKNLIHGLAKELSWKPSSFDKNNNCIKALTTENAFISYESTYGMLELSLSPVTELHTLRRKSGRLIRAIQHYLSKRNLKLFPIGINPYSWAKELPPISSPYYQMLAHFFDQFNPKMPYSISNWNVLISSSQVHLDVTFEELPQIFNALNALGWAKALLFANSPDFYFKKNCLCLRDLIWQQCALGYQRENVGIRNEWYKTPDEILLSTLKNSIFYVEREDVFCYFQPCSVEEYLKKDHLIAWQIVDNQRIKIIITPEKQDIFFSRSYNDVAITQKGTVEIRSECQQPFGDLMAPMAFNLGLVENLPKIMAFISSYPLKPLEFSSYRNQAIMKGYKMKMPFNIQEFLLQLLSLIQHGLVKRNLKEEFYLDCLFKRAEQRTNPSLKLFNKEFAL